MLRTESAEFFILTHLDILGYICRKWSQQKIITNKFIGQEGFLAACLTSTEPNVYDMIIVMVSYC